MKRLLLFAAVLMLSSPLALASIVGDFRFTRAFENTAGTVTFPHQDHAERYPDNCAFCHSALRTFGGQVNELFAHKVCVTCHESKSGPTDCNDCHRGHALTRK